MQSSTFIKCINLLTVICNAAIALEDEPTDKNIKEGEDHSFSCIVSGMMNEEIVWYKDGRLFTDATDNLRINIAENEFSYVNLSTLIINNVIKSDSGFYKCVVISSISHSIMSSSSEAELKILSLPNPRYPICSEPDSNILSGSSITLTCVSEKVNPAVNLQFDCNFEPVNTPIPVLFTETEDLIAIKLTIKAVKDNNGDVYKCNQYSSLDSNYQKSCKMKPLNVQYKPEIKIQHTDPVLPGRETILFCQTFANPSVKRYQWTMVPKIKEEDAIVDVTGQTLKLLRPSLEQSGTNITCVATNEIGKTSSSIMLKVSYSINNSENRNKPYESTDTLLETGKEIDLSLDVVIIIAAGVVIIIVLIVLVPVYHYCLCRNDNTTLIDSSEKEVTQPEVYYETREGVILRHTIQDRSLPRVPTTEVYGHWRHSTASQVPNDLESHSYTYIDT